jgi:hypothetical protein
LYLTHQWHCTNPQPIRASAPPHLPNFRDRHLDLAATTPPNPTPTTGCASLSWAKIMVFTSTTTYSENHRPPATNILPAQPPKRRGAPASSSTTTGPRRTLSKLAKENDITAEEENEIKEVFQLFADANEDFPAEKDGVMPREDVRKAMVYATSYRPLLNLLRA